MISKKFYYFLVVWTTPALGILLMTGSPWIAGLAGPAASFLLLRMIDAYAGHYGGLYFKRGGQGAKGYSEEQAMAKNGQRQEACSQLLANLGDKPDPEALRVCLKIAIARPLLAQAAMSACQGLLRHSRVSAADKEEYRRILAEVSPDATGSQYQVASHIK